MTAEAMSPGAVTAAGDAHTWTAACGINELIDDRGVCVLTESGEQVALFKLSDGQVRAVGNIDPFGQAAVMSRGLVGDRHGVPTVASPLLKQVFSLIDGQCLDDEAVRLPVYDTKIDDGLVYVGAGLPSS